MKPKLRIVGLLHASQKSFTAYQIAEICNVWFIYSKLKELEDEGSIQSAWVEGPYPRKRVYWIK